MEITGYNRYGLTGNPFRDLSSENISSVEMYHVNQKIDNVLRTFKEETIDKENKAVIALLGPLGSGKTHRLMLIKQEAKDEGHFCILRTITSDTKWVAKGISEEIIRNARLSGFQKIAGAPSWFGTLKKVSKDADKGFDPIKTGRAIGEALNEHAPSFLLLNDFHNLESEKQKELFLKTLHAVVDKIGPGVMIVISSYPKIFKGMMAGNPSLNQRINKKITIEGIHDKEAKLFIAKRLMIKRVVEDLDPLYPFTPEAVELLSKLSYGIPRKMLKYADIILDEAIKRKAIAIDVQFMESISESLETK